MIKNDGLEQLAELDQTARSLLSVPPLYDVIHLGNVLRRGHNDRGPKQPGPRLTAVS